MTAGAVIAQRLVRRWVRLFAASLVLSLSVASYSLFRAASAADALELQFARLCETFRGPGVVEHLQWDVVFILSFSLATWIWILLRYGDFRYRIGAVTLPWVFAAADLVEDGLTGLTRSRCPESGPAGGWGTAVYSAALLKWVAFALLVGLCLWLFGRRPASPQPPPTKPVPWPRPDPPSDADRLKPIVGISCSGGGIRSASFSLGALHGLGNEQVRNARYLAAVSGGGYTAAGMTVRAAMADADDPLPFAPESEELRRLRSKASYLALNGRDGRLGLGRIVATIAFNLLVLYAVVFVVGRPVGWLLQSDVLHPELQAATPLVHNLELTHPDAIGIVVKRASVPVKPCEAEASASYWDVKLDAEFMVSFDLRSSVRDAAATPSTRAINPVHGQVAVCDGEATLMAQPRLVALNTPEVGGQPEYRIEPQPQVRLTTDLLREPDEVRVEQALELVETPGLKRLERNASMASVTIDGWMWAVTALLLLLGAAPLIANRDTRRGQTGATLRLTSGPRWLLGTGALAGLLLIITPWLIQELPRAIAKLPDFLPGGASDATALGTSPWQWITTAFAAGGLGRLAVSRIVSGASKTKRGARMLLKVAAFLLLALAGVLMAASVVQQAALIGPMGRGSGAAQAALPWRFQIPDVVRWLAVGIALLVLKNWVSAQAWSLNPLYRDRLAAAFLGLRPGSTVAADPLLKCKDVAPNTEADTLVAKDNAPATTLTQIPYRPGVWPELVICCAANLNDLDRDAIPAGRWADTFTFSASEIGSPTIGYTSTREYLCRLSLRRQRDLTIASLVATSGAAVSSAMGKQAAGAIGGLFAALNIRLGLWLPNPLSIEDGTFKANPGWPYVLRELFGRFSWRHPFVYVTDGGHWENLGLVELMRRECRDIYVISAAGDGIDFFPTLGEALALAREQTGIEIEIDPSPLRQFVGAEAPTKGRQLLRVKDGELQAGPMARKPYVVGWWEEGETRGRVLFVEANLTAGTPWDVHAFAEKNTIFPDHPTSDQFFTNETFEAYRRLGEYQMQEAVASPEWRAAEQFVEKTLSTRGLKAALENQ